MSFYILALITVTVFFMVYQIIPFITYKIYKILWLIVTRTSHSSHIIAILNLYINYQLNTILILLCCITQYALSLEEPHYLYSLLVHRLNSHFLCSSSFNPLMLPFM